ncbi:hypothetical protein [Roseburia sp. MSJ-14]|uniref:hypothetical protein n=1 Tax=Roseburia sp. MSJ-14 TaxID=2841514 RepID=UPI001C117A3A|nr:hypothetical protein [Roseburia sp. MSJ-14]MBU5473990.1 hypothetical protein [Roseburia sp. MSJ-14]
METENKTKEEENKKKLEQVKAMREELARSMGASNYFFYLEANIKSKATRGI